MNIRKQANAWLRHISRVWVYVFVVPMFYHVIILYLLFSIYTKMPSSRHMKRLSTSTLTSYPNPIYRYGLQQTPSFHKFMDLIELYKMEHTQSHSLMQSHSLTRQCSLTKPLTQSLTLIPGFMEISDSCSHSSQNHRFLLLIIFFCKKIFSFLFR